VIGLKIHEDWGATPAVIDASLKMADKHDIQIAIHTDTLNESGFLESTMAAIDGRVIHTYHTEGAGGGHAPDIIKAAMYPHILPSSTNPTRPFTVNTIDETPGHAHGMPPSEQIGSRGCSFCRFQDQTGNDRGGGYPARYGCFQHDELRLAGYGAGERGDHQDLADGR
jgi:hypothetical protein